MRGASARYMGNRVISELVTLLRRWNLERRVVQRARRRGVVMSRRLVLMAAAIGLLFTGTGCSSMILAHQYSVGLDGSASSYFPLGASRQEVETKLGNPVTSRALPDGTRMDSYVYTIRDPNWRGDCFPGPGTRSLSACSAAIGSVITLGWTEPIFVPWALYEARKNRRTATFTYDANDRLLDHGPPPSYGSPDDAIEPLSHNGIKESCRSEHPAQRQDVRAGASGQPLQFPGYAYDECVVRRLAIWGIE